MPLLALPPLRPYENSSVVSGNLCRFSGPAQCFFYSGFFVRVALVCARAVFTGHTVRRSVFGWGAAVILFGGFRDSDSNREVSADTFGILRV